MQAPEWMFLVYQGFLFWRIPLFPFWNLLMASAE